ncbi:type II toxin-antitoxin system VapB family antitoxin [Leifsonia sp. H3M29-4]|uniref:type II toxin-antitoxin system VapB family antitoxin n=1 Tax=Salinibacterium metalliresistens TaxID=3031321 RepID=UPI0023DB5AA4|nr:type II toxin-antitoxin system VapB family antitoxin [Salinibacterium metalliresistens]MDF1478247.1 type II toxin-antitoxin system VapB family antitoxin [Salinibacterium metalliresistens]
MAVTSVDIDTEMLRLAKSSLGVRTNREAINLALRDVVMRRRQIEAIDTLATIPVDKDATTISYGDD